MRAAARNPILPDRKARTPIRTATDQAEKLMSSRPRQALTIALLRNAPAPAPAVAPSTAPAPPCSRCFRRTDTGPRTAEATHHPAMKMNAAKTSPHLSERTKEEGQSRKE